MEKGIKHVVRRSRSKLLGGTPETLHSIDGRLEALEHAQAEATNKQLHLLHEVYENTKNSGALVLSPTEIIAKLFSGLKMYLDARDLAITPHIALDAIWEYQITAAWIKAVKPHYTVLDIGSHNAYYGILAAQKTSKKQSKVVMFEANPGLVPYMQKTLDVNWLNEQSVIENMAVADKDGTLTLTVLKDYIGSSSVHSIEKLDGYLHEKMHLEAAEQIQVPATSIDNYCKKNNIDAVNLIMMDIEGFEDKAYVGMRDAVRASSDVTLFIEFTREGYDDPKGFYEQMLGDFGYVYAIDDSGNLIPQKDTSYEAVIGAPDDWIMPVFSKDAQLHLR